MGIGSGAQFFSIITETPSKPKDLIYFSIMHLKNHLNLNFISGRVYQTVT